MAAGLGACGIAFGAPAALAQGSTATPTPAPSNYQTTQPITQCVGYSQCPILNFQDVLTYDPDALFVNRFITQTERQTLQKILTGDFTSSTGAPVSQKSMLGKVMIYDRNLSVNATVACATCHIPQEAFTGGVSLFNDTVVAQVGAVGSRISARKPMSYAYAPFAPVLFYRASTGDFVGGNFWDDRATGLVTGNPAADQALGPPLNPVEMANPDPACVVYHIAKSEYASLFAKIWGSQSFNINWPANTAMLCAQPGSSSSTNPTVLTLSPADRAQATTTFHEFGLSIATYEAGPEVSPFTSKFDYYLKGQVSLTPTETMGMQLFQGKGNCTACHAMTPAAKPLFTDFTAINEGIPKDLEIPYYFENEPDNYGYVANPQGPSYIDDGVGAFLNGPLNTNPAWREQAVNFLGTFQTATVRNVGKKIRTDFTKAYMHNGYFKTLQQVVHWYNTAGALPTCPSTVGSAIEGPVGKTCWPAPEEPHNVNRTQMGNLGLSATEEAAIVAFMLTLTDGYKVPTSP